ncbi:MAG: glycosyltransferase family 2 protein [Acidobacteria bacterium]|nr:glycosyltransferase family 2 protein [Acidobacteriota bacterium]
MSLAPTVSVITTVYNVAPYIRETIDSLFAQTYRNFESIIINDGSTDRTEEVLEPYRDRIIYRKQPNRGVSNARNAGIRLARGQYIAFLDGDDIWLPHYLEKMIALLEKDKEAAGAFPNAIYFGSPAFDGTLYQDRYPASDPVTFERVLQRECYIFIAVLLRRSALDQAGMFVERMRWAEDLDLWLRILELGHRFTCTSEPLVKYRLRHDSLSSNTGSICGTIAIFERYLQKEGTTIAQRQKIEKNIAGLKAQMNLTRFKELMQAQDYKEATAQLEQAINYYGSLKLRLIYAAMCLVPALVKRWAKQ